MSKPKIIQIVSHQSNISESHSGLYGLADDGKIYLLRACTYPHQDDEHFNAFWVPYIDKNLPEDEAQ